MLNKCILSAGVSTFFLQQSLYSKICSI